ncbi:MAG TPA: ATP-binding protein [Gemmatimonadaceae bacterium]|nr:ATP-binding protein [Gemmatimonadaceae bacterium]
MMRNENVSRTGSAGTADGVAPAERLLLDIIDTVREPLLVLDSDFRVTHTNRAFFQTFRVAPEDTIGEVLFALGDGQWDIPPLRELLRDRLVAEPALYDVDVDHIFPGIGRKIMLLNARLVTHDPGAPRVILLAIEDVTERRLTERRLAAQRRELQRSNAALNEFAFVASHDLQEPLRKIVSFGERLGTSLGPMLEGNPRQYLERMLNAATRMRTLITDLLAYSQIATSVAAFAPTDLAAIARDVVADLETSIADTGGRIDLGALPVIDADAPQMRQLLQNLLGNALKFRRKDAAPVVQLGASSSRDGVCTISVTDNGIGFKQEHEERIFRMFERLQARTQYEGSGMGLAICRKIVERHGGTIAATSTTGEGTTFSVTLPVTQVDVEYVP